jgi:hypothetical protein
MSKSYTSSHPVCRHGMWHVAGQLYFTILPYNNYHNIQFALVGTVEATTFFLYKTRPGLVNTKAVYCE